MPPAKGNDTAPPPHWPSNVIYLTKPRLSPRFPPALLPLLAPSSSFAPRPAKQLASVQIKVITQAGHPANGQFGLFAKQKIKENELVLPYLGVIHVTYTPEDGSESLVTDDHSDSDYDLSLLRISASDPRNPFPGQHISIGVDAAHAGNGGRFVNDFRGVKPSGPNAEFRVGKGEAGELRMEIWSLKGGIGKGEELLVSYGKGWWGARQG
ncbi:hypothetical protein L202_02457 [Cryptococcus amylolentus CBS 6039]|uniref:SET domain-containing protein n=1 Tax=Cryptococcus amylolentus CBS 6039 TaxID=1295533 RepID=A0A1E3I0N5_9TREE|nr:hypothetical protein L202_02457 [Cryptococcus amylolentus CBS 6039]ODN82163.1 hypothetical protein L202_02457 [Cryptococcus amylolentus CBS 6039]